MDSTLRSIIAYLIVSFFTYFGLTVYFAGFKRNWLGFFIYASMSFLTGLFIWAGISNLVG